MSPQARTNAPKPGAKRYSLQLPLELAARLEALFEMHPKTSRSRLMADLLRLGVAEVQRAHAVEDRDHQVVVPAPPDLQQPLYLLTGPFAAFHKLSYQHHLALERAHAKDEPSDPRASPGFALGDAVALE